MRCDHRMLKHMAKVRWQDRGSNVENLEDRLRRARLRWFRHVKRREEGHILRRAIELEMAGKRLVGRPEGREWRRN